jgi:hypothetical protein
MVLKNLVKLLSTVNRVGGFTENFWKTSLKMFHCVLSKLL